jgi:hypothetical protein
MSKLYSTHNTHHRVYTPPKEVGYWVLYKDAPTKLKYAMYKKPLRIQIWFTEKLLGWRWEDA